MNPARPAPGARLIELSKLKKHNALALEFNEGDAWYSMLVARGGGDDVYAYENICPHAHAPLERFDGRVLVQDRKYLLCAMHGASFRMEDGACVGGPALGLRLAPIAVVVEAGWVKLA